MVTWHVELLPDVLQMRLEKGAADRDEDLRINTKGDIAPLREPVTEPMVITEDELRVEGGALVFLDRKGNITRVIGPTAYFRVYPVQS